MGYSVTLMQYVLKSTLGVMVLLLFMGCQCNAVETTDHKLTIDPQQERAARLLASALPQVHLSREEFSDAVAGDALEIFLRSLDPERVYFLKSDIDGFKAQAATLDDKIRRGDVQISIEIYTCLKQRVEDRVAYVEKLLADGFDLEAQETYKWKRKDVEWPASAEEQNEVWRKKIKHEYVARIVARKLAEEEPKATNEVVEVTGEKKEGDEAVLAEPVESSSDLKMTPEESILKSYKRYLTLLQDNEAIWVTDRYLTSFTQAYDPHSDYMSPFDAEDFDITMKLSLVGIGALLSSDDGAAKVERLIPGGPAERDGRLKPNDKIIAVAQGDGEPVDIMHWPLNKTVRLIRGEKNSKVVLSIIPASDTSGSIIKKIDLIRDEVKLEEQAAKGDVRTVMGSDGVERSIGIVTLPEFYADMKASRSNPEEARSASRDVKAILDDLKSKNVEGIILDLRNNGGGSLTEAIDLTGEFIESGPVVQVKDTRRLHILSDTNPETVFDGPLIVMVNRMSASASEILAGALQDYGRALIVGDSKTHGKGTVQTLTDLSNQNPQLGSLKVTTASFYRIAGGSTQRNGVTPDIVIPSLLENMELGEEFLPHAMPWSEVYQAFYEPREEIKAMIPALRLSSEKRRETDPKFETYSKLMSRMKERQDADEISLNIEDRLALARSERELQNMLKDADQTAEGDKKTDIVLSETLNILSDLITLNQKAQAEHSKPEPGQKS